MEMNELSLDRLQEMMGTEATREDARSMMSILSRECVGNTDDVSESQWLRWSEEAARDAESRNTAMDAEYVDAQNADA